MLRVVLTATIDTKIVYEYFHEILKIVLKYYHHCSLKCGRSITETKSRTKWHSAKSKCTPVCSECGLTLIFRPDMNLIITSIAIQEGKTVTSCNLVKYHIRKR